ncbi:uncharacterized protein LOC113426832 isoform X2 [Notechis scutatus]|uniref:Uncharacterized protein LOC113426832 isoform X2 n=1 Tax=Notechis scutatus TaxID=8663 RepID=A0A6J1VPN0_9SAUR|nr:uncharacterized protein LOC113426832 isoform X2 [Notechis scutatus]
MWQLSKRGNSSRSLVLQRPISWLRPMKRRMRGCELLLGSVIVMWMAALLTPTPGPRRQQQLQWLNNSRSSTVLLKTPAVLGHHLQNGRRRRRKTEAGLRADHLLEEKGKKAQRKRNTDQNQRKGSTDLQVPKANTNPRKRNGRGPPVSLHLRKTIRIALPPQMVLPHQMHPTADQAAPLFKKGASLDSRASLLCQVHENQTLKRFLRIWERESIHLLLSLPGEAGAQVLEKAEKSRRKYPSILQYVRPFSVLQVLHLLPKRKKETRTESLLGIGVKNLPPHLSMIQSLCIILLC